MYSWDGLLNGQTTLNGARGGRRPTLEWKLGDPIGETRLVVPVATARAASLPRHFLEVTAMTFLEFVSTTEFP